MSKVCGLGLVVGPDRGIHHPGVCSEGLSFSARSSARVDRSHPLAEVKGRIDHFGFDPAHNRLFISALGNNTKEIIRIGAQMVIHTISAVPTPQGVAYSPETNKLFVGSDEGKLYVYDGTIFDLVTSIDFGDDGWMKSSRSADQDDRGVT